MQFPALRFRIVWMIVAVAVVAGALGVARLLVISRQYRGQAGLHAGLEKKCTRLAEEFESIYVLTPNGWALRDAPDVLVPMPRIRGKAPESRIRTSATWNTPVWEGADERTQAPHDADEWRDEAARHGRLKAKYEHAAQYPWLSVDSELK
jgi:hypothetical protein